MLDYKRLEANRLLKEAGWSVACAGHLRERLSQLDSRFLPQISEEDIFQNAWDIIDALDGICINNQCPELGFSKDSHAIEFDLFSYDSSVSKELSSICSEIKKSAVYIGIGYDIIGDWLVDETGMIYFQNNIHSTLSPFSDNIYDFLEKDIYRYTDMWGKSIFASPYKDTGA